MSGDRVFVCGDDINTDDIIPAAYCTSFDGDSLKKHAFENLLNGARLEDFSAIEAGDNFGCGSSREHAPLAVKAAGVTLVRARSFAEIFYRNAINIGLPLEVIDGPPVDPLVADIVGAGGLFGYARSGRSPASDHAGGRPPSTMAGKLIAAATGREALAPGQGVLLNVDLAMLHDAVTGPVRDVVTREFGRDFKVWDREKVVFVADHFIQVSEIRNDAGAARLHRIMKDFAEEQGCTLFDVVAPGEARGICHVLMAEAGLVRPGTVVVGTDSHTCTLGAFGALALGVGTTDMAYVLATGRTWLSVPPTILVELHGTLRPGVSAKDVILMLIGRLGAGGARGRVLEFRGDWVDRSSMEERMTLANMAVECGAVSGLFAADGVTARYLAERGHASAPGFGSDPDADYERRHRFDVSGLEPQVAAPPSPSNVTGWEAVRGVPITKAYIGSCTGGKLSDLADAAEALAGRRVADGVELFIVPASQAVREAAERNGYMAIFRDAGARILKTACGACINSGPGVIGANETAIYATNRNFIGRNGHPTGRVYLASPRTVALSAVSGSIQA